MLKVALAVFLLTIPIINCNLVQNHEYWYTAMKSAVTSGASDYAWNYCDLKCLYFEHYYPGFDFVYINFS